MRKCIILVACICILLIAIPNSFAGQKRSKGPKCSLAGLWIVESSELRKGMSTGFLVYHHHSHI